MRSLVFTVFALSLAACSGDGQFVGQKANEDEEGSSSKGEDEEDPAASQPIPVSAAFLTCDDASDDATNANETAFGCRIASKVSYRTIDLAKIASKWTWEATPANTTAGITMAVDQMLPADGQFQAIYRFVGGDKASRVKFANDSEVTLKMTLKKAIAGFEGFNSTIDQALSNEAKVKQQAAAQVVAPSVASTTNPNTKPAVGPDADGDKVADQVDLCSHTVPGANVWTEGEWIGCSEKQYRNSEDTDRDGVSEGVDECPGTALGAVVDKEQGSETRGCSPDQDPPF